MKKLIVLALILCSVYGFSQSIQNVKASWVDGKVVLTYDLFSSKPNQKFELHLFASHNDFTKSLTMVRGDIGKSLEAGFNKRVIWDISEELREFDGIISFKLKGEVMPLPFAISSPSDKKGVRRGKKSNVEWIGGRPQENVKLELLKNGMVLSILGETKNDGVYAWSVPKTTEKGLYSIRLTSGKEAIDSKPFKVKNKTPLFLKVLPAAAAGGLVISLLSKNAGTDELPAPPLPTK